MGKNKMIQFLCICLPVSIVLIQYLTGGTNTFFSYFSYILCFVMAAYDPICGLSSNVILSVTSSINDVSNGNFIALFLGVLSNFLLHNDIKKINLNKSWLAFILIPCSLLSFFANKHIISIYILFFIEITMFFLLRNRTVSSMNKIDNLTVLSFAYICGAIIYSVFSILAMSSTTSRLRAFGTDTVRGLSNMLGITILFCVFDFAILKKKKLLYLSSAAFCFVVLLMTGSRGVLYSIIIVTVCLVVKMRLLNPKRVFAIAIVVIVSTFLVEQYMPSNINLSRIFESDDGSRLRIWKLLLESNGIHEWVFGIGLNNAYSTYGWYAHSVYVDALVSLGIVSFIGLVVFIISEIVNNFKNCRDISAFVLVAAVLLFLTHGSIFSQTFWSLIFVADCLPNKADCNMIISAERK